MQSDEQAIRQLVAAWMDATRAGDVDRVLGLMSEDVVFLVPGRPVMRKADFAAAAKAPAGQPAPTIEGTSDIQEIKVLGEWAFMWTKLKVVAAPPDGSASVTRAGYTLSILKKEHGKWMLARDANLLSAVPPAGG
jgi:uncharacterized protein (TIGR02246 family)